MIYQLIDLMRYFSFGARLALLDSSCSIGERGNMYSDELYEHILRIRSWIKLRLCSGHWKMKNPQPLSPGVFLYGRVSPVADWQIIAESEKPYDKEIPYKELRFENAHLVFSGPSYKAYIHFLPLKICQLVAIFDVQEADKRISIWERFEGTMVLASLVWIARNVLENIQEQSLQLQLWNKTSGLRLTLVKSIMH